MKWSFVDAGQVVEPQRRGLLARRAGGRQPGATTGGATLPRRWARIENGPVEIVDLPIDSMVDLSSSLRKRLPQGFVEYRKSSDLVIPSIFFGEIPLDPII